MTIEFPVVVGVDGSPHSRRAVRWAAADAVARSCPLLLVTSVYVATGTFSDAMNLGPGIFAQQETAGRELLAEAAVIAKQQAGDRPLVVDTTLAHGSATQALLDLDRTARLIVLGSRGLGEFTGGLLGSVSTAVATHARCPVVVLSDIAGSDPDADIWNTDLPVVVGVDGTAHSEPAIAAALEEASLRGVELVAVRAWSDVDLSSAFVGTLEASWAQHETGEAAALAESMAGWQEKFPEVGIRRVVVEDRPVRHLVRMSDDAGLIVVGSRGRGGFASMLLGSTSRAVLHAANCPVMIVSDRD